MAIENAPVPNKSSVVGMVGAELGRNWSRTACLADGSHEDHRRHQPQGQQVLSGRRIWPRRSILSEHDRRRADYPDHLRPADRRGERFAGQLHEPGKDAQRGDFPGRA